MLMSLEALADKYDMRAQVSGIIHGGAHLAEEAPEYDRIFGPGLQVLWIEANPGVYLPLTDALAPYPNQKIVWALLADVDGEYRTFHVTNYDGMSSSLLDFGTHPQFSPDTVFVRDETLMTLTLDYLLSDDTNFPSSFDPNMLVLDIQGAELIALRGAAHLRTRLDYVMLEVNKEDVYQGCAKVWDLDDLLLLDGLKRVETHWVEGQGWGDALWIRR